MRYVPKKWKTSGLFVPFKVRDTLLASKGEKCSISTRLPVNNHRSIFFYLNIFCFFEIWRHLTTNDAAWQPLPVNCVLCYTCTSFIWLFGLIFYVFGIDVLSRMSSSLLCRHLLYTTLFLIVVTPFYYSWIAFFTKFTIK